MAVLENLEPKDVFHYFEEISQIPRPSYHEKAVSDYLVDFAKDHQLEYYQDEIYNVIMIKEASAGRENDEPLILQGHMDMVCEQKASCKKDMMTEGLDLAIDGDYVYAEGTTLGGDDGIAVAMALALLADEELSHPRLEFVCTVSEEVGMDGAANLDPSPLKGHLLLNIDSEDEGILTAGCAGGCHVDLELPMEKTTADGNLISLEIDGLLGGHSGTEINKGRQNADHMVVRLLTSLEEEFDFALVGMSGGSKDNAIPSRSEARIVIRADKLADVKDAVKEFVTLVNKENDGRDAGMYINVTDQGAVSNREVYTKASFDKACAFVYANPNGIQAMCAHIPGLPETSLNLGIMNMTDKGLRLCYSLRSSQQASMTQLRRKLGKIAQAFGAEYTVSSPYPAWEFRADSAFRNHMVEVYEKLYGEKPQVVTIHAGLECGLLSGKIKDLDSVSIGPNMRDIHTPQEKLSISSTQRTYEYVKGIVSSK